MYTLCVWCPIFIYIICIHTELFPSKLTTYPVVAGSPNFKAFPVLLLSGGINRRGTLHHRLKLIAFPGHLHLVGGFNPCNHGKL